MSKTTISSIIFFILIKYLLFYIFMMFKNDNYALIKFNELKNGEDLFYYLWTFLSLPVICIILFTLPLYYSLRAKSRFLFYFLIICVFVLEYIIYTYLASQLSLLNGVVNLLIGVILFVLFYYRTIRTFITGRSNSLL